MFETGGVYDKLQMFKLFRDGQNLYFDLDVVITGDCNKFLKRTICCKSLVEKLFTPLNSSIISWYGDKSEIYNLFTADLKRSKRIYYRGIDQYIYHNFDYCYFSDGYCSTKTIKKYDPKYAVYLFNQNHTEMRWRGWCQKFLLNRAVSEQF